MSVPSANLGICRGIKWDSGYNDVQQFSNAAAQHSFISSFLKFSLFNNFSYIRNQPGKPIRVPLNEQQLIDCNYIFFQNAAFGTKWFYAFIDRVEYVSDETSYIYFTEDIYQTWQFQIQIDSCYVEREHTNDDTIGKNTVPEGLETGEYITSAESEFTYGSELIPLNVIVMSSENFLTLDPPGFNSPAIINGMPNAMYWLNCGAANKAQTAVKLKNIIDEAAKEGKSDALTIFLCPYISPSETVNDFNYIPALRTLPYTIKNNKLACFPYVQLAVSTPGQSQSFRYENFSNIPRFKMTGTFGVNTKITVAPLNYEGEAYAFQYQMCISGFPLIPWTKNYYENYVAQNAASLKMGLITTTGGAIARAAAGDVAGASLSLLSSVGSTVAKLEDMKAIPDQLIGSASAPEVNAVAGRMGVYSYCRCIKEEYAKIIDDYFTRFGYKTNRIKVPNITGRTAFNFVKTIGAHVHGQIPVYVSEQMENMLNRGVTFWHSTDLGNYSLDNSIVTG